MRVLNEDSVNEKEYVMFHELGTGKCFVSKDAILNSCVVFIVPWEGGGCPLL